MTKLSVNINKIAVVRNSRGGTLPDVVRAALDIERFGAEGITVHPRPDARHIRYDDVRDLKRALTTELNIEGNPIPGFIDLVLEVVPAGDAGSRRPRCHHLERRVGHSGQPRVPDRRDGALPREGHPGLGFRGPRGRDGRRGEGLRRRPGGTRHLEAYANIPTTRSGPSPLFRRRRRGFVGRGWGRTPATTFRWRTCAGSPNASPWTDEVSIGHALICDALYYGLENTVQLYRRELKFLTTMKRILILAAALFTVCTAFAQSEYNLQRRSLFEVLPVYSSDIVFLGNSITDLLRAGLSLLNNRHRQEPRASAATARGGCSTVSTRSSGGIPRNCF